MLLHAPAEKPISKYMSLHSASTTFGIAIQTMFLFMVGDLFRMEKLALASVQAKVETFLASTLSTLLSCRLLFFQLLLAFL